MKMFKPFVMQRLFAPTGALGTCYDVSKYAYFTFNEYSLMQRLSLKHYDCTRQDLTWLYAYHKVFSMSLKHKHISQCSDYVWDVMNAQDRFIHDNMLTLFSICLKRSSNFYIIQVTWAMLDLFAVLESLIYGFNLGPTLMHWMQELHLL